MCVVQITKQFFCLFLLLAIVACSSEKIELIANIQQRGANDIVAALLMSGIEAEKVKGKKSVSVVIYKKDMAAAVDILRAKGLPNQNHSNLGEIFKKEGMVSTPLEERARYIYALSQELEYTLSQIDGVLVARVHVVLPERIAPGQPIQPPSAAIFVKHLPTLDSDVVRPKIKRIVTSSIPGLSSESIDKISVSFVESAIENPSVKWVKVWGYLLTEDSAKAFKKSIMTFAMVLLVMIVLLLVVSLLLYKKKKKQILAEKHQKENTSSDEDIDFFTGDKINR